ncbi:uncharacterized protein LOC126656442 [Mercurialis annua]|uniref:uncharacterized protein LOC126656442 n=1 Tax=Mercurialis annua TaxID=3986 RepID=UPI0021609E04|nr:uncharacterized protein LOC126656442 [Mercurialis annua]
MADIAMLVAEEYERRVKNSRNTSPNEEVLISWASRLSFISESSKIKSEEDGNSKWGFEAKSGIGAAASTAFFSA